jgi:hypothetical protein
MVSAQGNEGLEWIELVAREYSWRYALPWAPIVDAWRAAARRTKSGRPALARLKLPKPYDLVALAQCEADVRDRMRAEDARA